MTRWRSCGGVERLNQRAELFDERLDAVVLSVADGLEDLPEGKFDAGDVGDGVDVRNARNIRDARAGGLGCG